MKNQSLAAREAVRRSSSESGFTIEHIEKDDDDVPQPDAGVHWSLSHTSKYVAGVVAPRAVGIDVEGPRPIREELMERVMKDSEAELFGGRDERGFLRVWTAKEAFLKSIGLGIAGLSRCRVVEIRNEKEIELEFDSAAHLVYQTVLDDHVAALCLAPASSSTDSDLAIDWILP